MLVRHIGFKRQLHWPVQVAEWIGKRLMQPYLFKFVPSPQDGTLLDEMQTCENLNMDDDSTAFGTFDNIDDAGLLVRKVRSAGKGSGSVTGLLTEAGASAAAAAVVAQTAQSASVAAAAAATAARGSLNGATVHVLDDVDDSEQEAVPDADPPGHADVATNAAAPSEQGLQQQGALNAATPAAGTCADTWGHKRCETLCT